jgi:hypothetical protein
MKRMAIALLGVLAMTGIEASAVTVLCNDSVIEVENTLADPTDLWVSPEDLTRINGFELKPEGACLDSICIPLKQDEDSEAFVRRDGQPWVNVTALARKLEQPFVVDRDEDVWSFGGIPATRGSFLASGMAPNFALEDREGNTVRLQDFRGKKVLLVTWASW